jgi:succinate dehydrogenase / fumarate reductase iron-sulfur subunit
VAACPNASSALFTGAKIAHLSILPQGEPERDRRALNMVAQMNIENFGGCTNIGECTGACPKEIPLEVIATMNRDYIRGSWKRRDQEVRTVTPMTEWSTGSKLKIDPHATS